MKRITAADLFCGAGGASVGLRRATERMGVGLDLLAINHWPLAVETHSLNHPDVRHMCEAVERVNPREAVPSGRLHLLIAAPECTSHSRARGGRPVNDQSRATAWHILKWAQELYIDNILIENVEEFREWGPLGANGKPLKTGKGHTYRAFIEALRSLGYKVEDRVLNAADYGDPTTRRRLFIMARRGRKPIEWPVPSHSKTGARTLFGKTERWRAAREVIDWSVQGRSIFGRKKPLSPKTMARIMAGLQRFGGAELEPFLVILRNNATSRSLDEPVPTLSAQGQHMALCEPFILQQQSGGAPRALTQPLPTIATDGAQMLVEPFLVPHFGERNGQRPRTHSVDQPVPTIAATGQIDVVQPFLVPVTHGGGMGRVNDLSDPMPTITCAHRGETALVEPFLQTYYKHGGVTPVSSPMPTITTKDRIALVMPTVNGRALDVRLRMLKPHELARAMSFGDDYQFAGNQGEQVKQIGNAWACKLGEALIHALIEGYGVETKSKPHRLEAIA